MMMVDYGGIDKGRNNDLRYAILKEFRNLNAFAVILPKNSPA